VVADQAQVPVAVAVDAVQEIRGWHAVFGRYGDFFEARPLALGRSDGRFVEVLEGLAAGEKYAAKNSFLIKADIGKSGASHDH
jgi:cobalt-zinc-cadmium efflux system membrane fusion protein